MIEQSELEVAVSDAVRGDEEQFDILDVQYVGCITA